MIKDATGAQINNLTVLFCRTKPDVIKVTNRTLDGQYFTQQIGTGATKAEVQLIATGMTARDAILNLYAIGAPLTVEFDGLGRTGIILNDPSVEVIKKARNVEDRVFVINFEMGVNEVVL